MSEVHIVATFFPLPEKVERTRYLLMTQCAEVHQKEDYALRFLLTEEIETQTPQFCLFETYSSLEGCSKHFSEPHFQQMLMSMKEEGLLAKDPHVAKTFSVGGFDLGRKWIAID